MKGEKYGDWKRRTPREMSGVSDTHDRRSDPR